MISTGPIDAFFNEQFGKLRYRSLEEEPDVGRYPCLWRAFS
jgi:UDP-galactopyranose mutase